MTTRCVSILAIITVGAGFACAESGGQYVVVIDSDLLIPSELAQIQVRASGEGQGEGDGASFDPSLGGLPLSMGVEPPSDGRLIIDVVGLDSSGIEIVHRLAVVQGPVGDMTRVPIFLSAACRNVQCSDGETCTEGGCGSNELSSDVLTSIGEGDELGGLCRPNEGRCTTQTSYERCPRYGARLEVGSCAATQECDPTTFECVDPANINKDLVRVEVEKVGPGAGYVSTSDNKLDCGPTCTVDVPRGTSFVLQANPDGASSFVSWEGDCTGVGVCNVVANAPVTVRARFDTNVIGGQHELTVDLIGTGFGRVVSTPAGIDCATGICRAFFPAGTNVTLLATPQGSSGFTGWFGECSGLADCQVRMDSPRWATANFAYDDGGPDVNLQIYNSGDGTGRITSLPAGIDCGPTCNALFVRNTQVRLQATPDPDNRFERWEGACSGTGDCVVDVRTNLEVSAIFTSNNPRFVPMDVNGDGFQDLVVGAPGTDVGSDADRGRVYVVFGPKANATMMALSADRIYDGAGPNARAGTSVAVGDLDGDGYDDIAIGAPRYQDRGAVHIIFGGPGIIGSTSLSTGGGPMVMGDLTGEAFGTSLAVADLTGDGTADLLVGAPGSIPGDIGRAYLFQGGPGFNPSTTNVLVRFESDRTGDRFGSSVAVVGDANADGLWDIAIGAPDWSPNQDMRGRVSLFYGRTTHIPNTMVNVADVTLDGEQPNDQIGWSIAAIGDFNQDGVDDFALGSPINDRVHVHFGRTLWNNGSAAGNLVLSGIGWFGAAISGGHDVTGDFVPDLVVGAPFWEGDKGAVEIFAGSTSPSVIPIRRIEGRCINDGSCGHEFFGVSVDLAVDLDATGTADVIVGSRYGGGTAGNQERGRVSTFNLPSHVGSGPIRSSDADVHLVGEDQFNAWCSALPGSRVFD